MHGTGEGDHSSSLLFVRGVRSFASLEVRGVDLVADRGAQLPDREDVDVGASDPVPAQTT